MSIVGRRKNFDKDVAAIVAQADCMTDHEKETHEMFVKGYVPVDVALDILRDYDAALDAEGHSFPGIRHSGLCTDDELRGELDRRVSKHAISPTA